SNHQAIDQPALARPVLITPCPALEVESTFKPGTRDSAISGDALIFQASSSEGDRVLVEWSTQGLKELYREHSKDIVHVMAGEELVMFQTEYALWERTSTVCNRAIEEASDRSVNPFSICTSLLQDERVENIFDVMLGENDLVFVGQTASAPDERSDLTPIQ